MEKREFIKQAFVVDIKELPNDQQDYLYKITEDTIRYPYHQFYLDDDIFSIFIKAATGIKKGSMVLLYNWW